MLSLYEETFHRFSTLLWHSMSALQGVGLKYVSSFQMLPWSTLTLRYKLSAALSTESHRFNPPVAFQSVFTVVYVTFER